MPYKWPVNGFLYQAPPPHTDHLTVYVGEYGEGYRKPWSMLVRPTPHPLTLNLTLTLTLTLTLMAVTQSSLVFPGGRRPYPNPNA